MQKAGATFQLQVWKKPMTYIYIYFVTRGKMYSKSIELLQEAFSLDLIVLFEVCLKVLTQPVSASCLL